MLSLRTRSLPRDASALRDALEESLNQVLKPAAREMVAVEDRNYPELASIRVSLDEAVADDPPASLLEPLAGAVEPALQVEHFELSGRPVRVQQAAIDLSCVAQDVEIAQARDREGNLLLLLQKVATGKIEISLSVADLQSLIRSAAGVAAAKQGAVIENVQVLMRAQTERSLQLEVSLRARKLFLSTELRINGSIELDEHLNLKLSGLECQGEGTLGTLACSLLGPHLRRLDGRNFPLVPMPLGEVKLHDIQIAVDPDLRVSAQIRSGT
jgi:hypothetical protein